MNYDQMKANFDMIAEVGVVGEFYLRRKIKSDWHLGNLIRDIKLRINSAAERLPAECTSDDDDCSDNYLSPDPENRPPRIQVRLKIDKGYPVVYKEFAYDQKVVPCILARVERELNLQFGDFKDSLNKREF